MEFLKGKDYPWLCTACRMKVDLMAELIPNMPDTTDNEAPVNAVYDRQLYCGGHECVNRPKEVMTWVIVRRGFDPRGDQDIAEFEAPLAAKEEARRLNTDAGGWWTGGGPFAVEARMGYHD